MARIIRCQHIGVGVVCQSLRSAFVYKIVDDSAKTQSFWLVDFDGNHYELVTIPAATEFYGDETYTYDITFPGYNYELYEISYSFGRDLGTSVYDPSSGDIEATGSLGIETGWTVTVEREYGPDRTTPPSVSIGTLSITEDITAQRIIPAYFYGEPSTPTGADPRPPTSIFEDDIGDGDDFFDWSEIWNSGNVSAVVGDGDQPGFSLIPWILEPDDTPPNEPVFSGSNPDGNWNLVDTNDDGDVDRISGFVRGVYRYVTQWNGSLSVSVPPGQSKTPNSQEFSETQVFGSYANGKIQIVIRDTARPSGRIPGEAGQVDGAFYPNVYTFELHEGTVSTPLTLAYWMSFLNNGNSFNEILNDLILDSGDDYVMELLLESRLNGDILDRDYSLSTTQPIIKSDATSVWGFEIEIDIFGIENILLNESSHVNREYSITPIHVVEDYGGQFAVLGGGDGFDDDILPLADGISESLVEVTVIPFENQESFDGNTFSVEQVIISWTDNSINVCHDTSQIISPNFGGS